MLVLIKIGDSWMEIYVEKVSSQSHTGLSVLYINAQWLKRN